MSKEHIMTETETEKLKPCPFCGGEATLNDYRDAPAGAWVLVHRAKDCFLAPAVQNFGTEKAALTAWNTRPDEGEPVAWRWRKRGADVPWIVGSARIEGEGVDGFYEIQPLYTRPAQAAAEITRLASRIEELERALGEIAAHFERAPGNSEPAHMAKRARQALSDKG
jgi:hypothetical protein